MVRGATPQSMAADLQGFAGDVTLVFAEPGVLRSRVFLQAHRSAWTTLLGDWEACAELPAHAPRVPPAHIVYWIPLAADGSDPTLVCKLLKDTCEAKQCTKPWLQALPALAHRASVIVLEHMLCTASHCAALLLRWPATVRRLRLWSPHLQAVPAQWLPGRVTTPAELDLSGCCTLTTLPNLGMLRGLTSLRLGGCRTLQLLPEDIGTLQTLRALDLTDCSGLVSLPDTLCRLTSLQSLELAGCMVSELPEPFSALVNLRTLTLPEQVDLGEDMPTAVCLLRALMDRANKLCVLPWSESLQQLPAGLGQLRDLVTLDLAECVALRQLPDQAFSQLTALATLDLTRCRLLTSLPASLASLPRLATLVLHGCVRLCRVPPGLVRLRHLVLNGCDMLANMDAVLSHAAQLETLEMQHLINLTQLPESICTLTNLRYLDADGCALLSDIPDTLGRATALVHLRLSRTHITTLPASLGQLAELRVLDVSWCGRLRSFPDAGFAALQALETLDVRGCAALTALPASISACVPTLATRSATMPALELLKLASLTALPDSVGQWVTLERATLVECAQLTSLPDSICQWKALTELCIVKCGALTELPAGLGGLSALVKLTVRGCRVRRLPDTLCDLPRLAELDLQDSMVSRLPGRIGRLITLNVLNMRSSALDFVPQSVGDLVQLRVLDLRDCFALHELPVELARLTHLRDLHLPRHLQFVPVVARLMPANERLRATRDSMLALVVAGYRCERYRLPAELWWMVDDLLWQGQADRWPPRADHNPSSLLAMTLLAMQLLGQFGPVDWAGHGDDDLDFGYDGYDDDAFF